MSAVARVLLLLPLGRRRTGAGLPRQAAPSDRSRTPHPVIERLSREVAAATRSAEITGKRVEEAVIPVGSTADEFNAHIRRELARWAKVIAKAGISED